MTEYQDIYNSGEVNKTSNLDKFKNYIEQNPQSSDTTLKKWNTRVAKNMKNDKEQCEKINKIIKQGDNKIKKLRKEKGI